MKLYLSPGACSQACHIVLQEAGLAFTPVRVNLRNHTLEDGSDYLALNPKGYVPMLELDTGERLTEVPVVLEYIADLAPNKNLLPTHATMARYRVKEWVHFTSTELHKNYGALFSPAASEERKTAAREMITKRMAHPEQHLAGREFMVGDHFSIADAYLFVVAGWSHYLGLDLSGFPNLTAFLKRIGERPAVQAVQQVERAAK